MTKIIGKPYAGKLHVRFDEGAGKAAASSRSTLPCHKYISMKLKSLKPQAASCKMRAACLLFALCTFNFSLAQQVIYVDASNNTGIEDGTMGHPFNTIKEGINAASPGYQVMIKQGTYIPDDSWSGNPHTLMLKAGVSLVGEGADITIIQGIVVDQENSNLSIGIEKLRFDEFYFARGTHEGPFTEPNIIKDCSTDHIDLPFGPGIPVNDSTPGFNYGFLIANNDLGSDGIIDFKQGAGVSDLTVQNNSCGYIYLKSGEGYTYLIDNNDIENGIFDSSGANNTTISNNRIVNGCIDDKSGGNLTGVEDQIIENNAITADENSPAFAEEDYKAAINARSTSLTIRNNTITCTGHVSGIRTSAGAPMHIIDNTITLDEIQVPDPDPYEGTSGIFNYSGWGYVTGNKIIGGNMGYYSKAGTVEFGDNEIENSYTGFYSMGAEVVHHNTIKNCKSDGMILNGLKGPLFDNKILDNGGAGIRITRVPIDLGGGADTCPGNNILSGNGNFDLFIECQSAQFPVLYAKYNVWDHTDAADIIQYDIRDAGDSTGLVSVDFAPFAYLGTEEQGAPEAWGQGSVEVWPNPGRGIYSLQFTIYNLESVRVEVVDLYGKVLETWNHGTMEPGTWNPEPGTWNAKPGTLELDITGYPAGIYFIRIISGNGQIVKKIIKL